MAFVYCYRCPGCGESFTSGDYALSKCPFCSDTPARDYHAEGAAPQTLQLKREREAGGRSAIRDMFLPTAKEEAGPGDPDGTKAIRQWNDEHEPKSSNKRPLRPESPRRYF